MVRSVAVFVFASISLSAVALIACVGDDPVLASSPSNDAGVDAATSLDSGVVETPPSEDAGVDAETANPYWVFMTSDKYDGIQVKGLAGADSYCQNIADAHRFPGSYKAWLSDSSTIRSARFRGKGPWKLIDGTTVFSDLDHMREGVPLVPVDRTVDNSSSDTSSFWSGTALPDAGVVNCNNWTNNLPTSKGESGDAHFTDGAKSDWDAREASPCSDTKHLLCLRAD